MTTAATHLPGGAAHLEAHGSSERPDGIFQALHDAHMRKLLQLLEGQLLYLHLCLWRAEHAPPELFRVLPVGIIRNAQYLHTDEA